MQLTVHGNKSHRAEPMEAAKCGGHPNYEFRGALHRGTGKADGQVRGVHLRWLVLHCLRPLPQHCLLAHSCRLGRRTTGFPTTIRTACQPLRTCH